MVRFVFTGPPAQAVFLVGDFNGWSPTATPLDLEADGTWAASVFLDPGTYEYKFYVDNEWKLDPDNPDVSENGNSMVRVGAGGAVLPLGAPGESETTSTGGKNEIRWLLRYLGFITMRRQPELGRWDLERPLHDVDLRLEVDIGEDVTGWFLTNFNNREEGEPLSRTSLRYDRGLMLWRPEAFEVRLFDNTNVTDFEDPGSLVGKIGIYDDSFGYERRGVLLRRPLLGAPFEFFYSDNTEAATDSSLTLQLPDLETPPPAGTAFATYSAVDTRRNGDTFAIRLRAGSEARGLGLAYRLDRGVFPGLLSEGVVQADAGGAFASGRQVETVERWSAWNADLRLPFAGLHWVAEYMSADRRAEAERQQVLEEARFDSTTGAVQASFGPQTAAEGSFDLDESRRVVFTVSPAIERRDFGPSLRYDYEEHDYDALVTGTPILIRRHGASLGLEGRLAGIRLQLDLAQDWYDYPAGSTWETQFWFRRHNLWLDESKAGYERFVLLGLDEAATASLEASRQLWSARHLDASLRCTASSPGFDQAPRYVETVLRFGIDVAGPLRLQTHSRFATFRRFETSDPGIVASLGPGPHFEAGALAATDIPGATHDYRTLSAHFVELVYQISERSDISLGFGVDPYVVYEVRNTYMDIGWDQFLFDDGASPGAAFTDPVGLGDRMERAEHDLQLERRLTVEARIQF